MSRCTGCGVELYALNMVDSDFTICQQCERDRKEAARINDMETTLVLWEGQMNRR